MIRKIFKIIRDADYLTLQNLNLASLVNTILKKINKNIRKTTNMIEPMAKHTSSNYMVQIHRE